MAKKIANTAQHAAGQTAEALPEMTSVVVPVATLQAALMCAAGKGERYYLEGAYIHAARVDDADPVLRVVSTDGHRMLVCNVPQDEELTELPEWAEKGVIVPAPEVKRMLGLFSTFGYETVLISYATGADKVEISDLRRDIVARFTPIDGAFPDYECIIANSVGAFDADNLGDFEAVSFNSTYLKGVSDIARQLNKADPKVSLYSHSKTEATVVTFSTPGVVLYLMPARSTDRMPTETAAILSPAVKSTVAALRAHKTRIADQVKAATDDSERAQLQAKLEDYDRRIADVLARTGQSNALPGPDNAEASAEQPKEEAGKPATKAARPDLSKAVAEPEDTPAAKPKRKAKAPTTAPRRTTFEDWRKQVDRYVSQKIGMGLDELPDVPIRAWFDIKMAPEKAATRAIEYALAA